VTPCCDGLYRCRFCHDEEQGHTLRREDVTRIECSQCGQQQDVREYCLQCNLKFGQYFCYDCKLYDDEDKKQFHCSGCGICRVGGRENYFHCHRCDMCLPNHLENKHKCVEKVSRINCPVCQEDIHTSRIPSQIPPCNHLIHKTCFEDMLSNGHYACPVCGVSMMDMKDVWKIYDKEISETPMPEEYLNLLAAIQCRDCFKPSLSQFHILGMKCDKCGSYNTVREKGPLVRRGDQEGTTSTDNNPTTPEDLVPTLTTLAQSDPMDETYPVTPPETPNREEQLMRVVMNTLSNTTESMSMTPEPSPLRENGPSREGNVSQVARRISFSEDSPELE